MSNFFNGVRNFVSYTFNSLDQTSAANDIIVVRHRDGTLHSSPFNVRFGKAKVIRPGDKVVTIECNGAPTSAVMKMGDDGVAFWLVPTSHAAKHQGNLSSPLQSPRSPASPEPPVAGVAQHLSLESPPSGSPTTLATAPAEPGSPGAKLPPTTMDGEVQREVVEETDGQVVQVVTQTEQELPLEAVQKFDELLASLQQESGNPAGAVAVTQSDGGDSPQQGASFSCKSGDGESPSATSGLIALADQGSSIPGADDSTTSNGGGGLRLSKFASSVDDITALHNRGESSLPDDGPERASPNPAGGGAYKGDYTEDPDSSSFFTGSSDSEYSDDSSQDEGENDGHQELDGSIKEQEKKVKEQQVFKRSFQPLGLDLEKLNLKPGCNIIKFNTNSRLRGSVSITANIFLWTSDTKIVISDIDGTVTKSDVWGHLLPRVGKDWTHPGICDLYDSISKNGYEFLYVTARSVSQIDDTKKFVFGIKQKGVSLPNGPLITAPDRLWDAITQEVGHRSHEFKIACLKSVSSAFPRKCNPFFAGFGNRIGDVIAYGAANIPKHKIMIIDAHSAVHVASLKGTYSSLAELVDMTFPPVEVRSSTRAMTADPGVPSVASGGGLDGTAGGDGSAQLLADDGLEEGEHVDQQYTSFNYWNNIGSYFPPEEEPKKKKADAPSASAAAGQKGTEQTKKENSGDRDMMTPSPTGTTSAGNSKNASPNLRPTNNAGTLTPNMHKDPNSPGLPPAQGSSNGNSVESMPLTPEGENGGADSKPAAGGWFSWGRGKSKEASPSSSNQHQDSSQGGASSSQ